MSKMQKLQKVLKGMGSVVVAYSGGVDSAFLLRVAIDTLGRENVLAVTARSAIHPEDEYRRARAIARALGARHLAIRTDELGHPRFARNPADRCYYCKRGLFRKLDAIRKRRGMGFVVDGSNIDDLKDVRPGTRAAEELGVRRPLREARMAKIDIRRVSRRLELPTWDKPSLACLASRVPFGSPITKEVLRRIQRAEAALRRKGFGQVRVRSHGPIARIEVPPRDFRRLVAGRKRVYRDLRSAGFIYVAMDLAGYRTGSMHEGEGQ